MQLMAIDNGKRNLLKLGALSLVSPGLLGGCAMTQQRLTFEGSQDRAPKLIGGAIRTAGGYEAVVASQNGQPVHHLPLPQRGHGVAIRPGSQTAVVFGRRPGTYAMVLNYQSGQMETLIPASPSRHFYGHGVYSLDGHWLYATEGETASSRGVIGVYDAQRGYQKVEEFTDFGIGPHEIIVMSDGTLVVGVGGVHTDGRTPLNLISMVPSLSYLSPSGAVLEQVGLSDTHKSIRHLAHDGADTVLTGQQYRGESDRYVPLVAMHKRGESMQELGGEPEDWARFKHYIASIAANDSHIVATSPRGNCYGVWDKNTKQLLEVNVLPDASGVVVKNDHFFISSGAGRMVEITPRLTKHIKSSPTQWDNHWHMIT
ncbi:hypothetical protein BCU70_11035 [Vibrio sp. 10N.286.49.C2]|uniref:DUF1513 domain-containing protein n=1 Tax=unclassified Vibrio TaxID=2614977 RepID=UPI000C818035|nr:MULTISPECIES: DUF1513 domain-containing protein [unclassified Vibrio]PMH40688.1 hypothetical protein BCU70_11035 [Vibrio sp. 10N.286.49.C2]PMH45219.1 hypothetical protein BCU66_02635 [Vibrio sp. 10N.286.49.B1]PMH80445.1 hypothetical protein BCU58_23580 [Vibrio sp. 10N.286.48.B7]